ncbi:MAG: LysR substrate-binding domain-containing protein [Hyphomicrobiales bacterium]|nr:LysR substrate-binding domain-containing protein [Hyphomicrobiales bacterium]
MNRTQVRSFHAAAELGGFTAAAKILSISQPTITTQVRSLEAEYGVELFVRNGRRVQLTPVGEELYEITKRIMLHETEARQFLQAHAGNLAGHLRLAAVGPFHATDVLVALKTQFPDIQVSVLLGNSQLTLQRLLDFDADVAMIAHFEDDPRVEMVPFSHHRVVVFVYEGHPWFGKKSVTLSRLEGENFILREKGSTTRLAFEQALERTGVTINSVVEIGSREAVWKAVEQGLGVGVVADFEFVPHPRLATVEISDVEIRTNYHIAFLKERRDARLIQTLVRIAQTIGNTDLS